MAKKKVCNPIAVVASKPRYSGNKSEGWVVCVDYAGFEVPEIRVRGGEVCGSCTDVAPDRYSGEYPFVVRVEYFFKYAPFKNAYKNMCRFETKLKKRMAKIQKKYETKNKKAISPISVSDVPEVQGEKFWKVSVRYDGDWERYFPRLRNYFEYNPFGAKITKCIYDETENITLVEYRFRRGFMEQGELRAWVFIDKIRAQILAKKRNENIK